MSTYCESSDLFVGLCIQEVAAMSAMLGGESREQRANALERGKHAVGSVKVFSTSRGTTAHLVEYANLLLKEKAGSATLATGMRLMMLNELLQLQALEILEIAISSVLMSSNQWGVSWLKSCMSVTTNSGESSTYGVIRCS